MSDGTTPRITTLLIVAVATNLLVTGVRFGGELAGWDPQWFSTGVCGGASPVGIVALVPVFGFLFGRHLARRHGRPPFVASFFVPMFGAAAIAVVLLLLTHRKADELRTWIDPAAWTCLAMAALALFAWPRACLVHAVYTVLVRGPILLLAWLDVQNGWQTHYGKLPAMLAGAVGSERTWLLMQEQLCVGMPATLLAMGAFAALGAATVRAG